VWCFFSPAAARREASIVSLPSRPLAATSREAPRDACGLPQDCRRPALSAPQTGQRIFYGRLGGGRNALYWLAYGVDGPRHGRHLVDCRLCPQHLGAGRAERVGGARRAALARISHTIFARSIGSADDFLSWQALARRRGVGRRVARLEVFGLLRQRKFTASAALGYISRFSNGRLRSANLAAFAVI
jgi:hypothetical protein